MCDRKTYTKIKDSRSWDGIENRFHTYSQALSLLLGVDLCSPTPKFMCWSHHPPSTPQRDLIWEKGHCRCIWVREGHTGVGGPYSDMTAAPLNRGGWTQTGTRCTNQRGMFCHSPYNTNWSKGLSAMPTIRVVVFQMHSMWRVRKCGPGSHGYHSPMEKADMGKQQQTYRCWMKSQGTQEVSHARPISQGSPKIAGKPPDAGRDTAQISPQLQKEPILLRPCSWTSGL